MKFDEILGVGKVARDRTRLGYVNETDVGFLCHQGATDHYYMLKAKWTNSAKKIFITRMKPKKFQHVIIVMCQVMCGDGVSNMSRTFNKVNSLLNLSLVVTRNWTSSRECGLLKKLLRHLQLTCQ